MTQDENGNNESTTPTINNRQGEHQQKHRIGTRIKVMGEIDGKRKTFYGTTTSFDPWRPGPKGHSHKQDAWLKQLDEIWI